MSGVSFAVSSDDGARIGAFVDPAWDDTALPGVDQERLNAYLTAKKVAQRGAIASDVLALAAFLAAVDRELLAEEPEEDEEPLPDAAETDRALANLRVKLAGGTDEDEEEPGFEQVEGRDEWPPARARGESLDAWIARSTTLFQAGMAPKEYYA